MGAVISRWKKTKPTTVEQLENLDKEITNLEEFQAKNQRLQKLWVGRLLIYSSILYLLTCLVVYCLYLPEPWLHRLAMALPFFIYPALVWFIRKFLIFLFSKRTERNSDTLEELKATKKKILEEVKETETYKNAKVILERFDPEAKKNLELESTPVQPPMTPRPGQDIRQRGVAMRPPGTPAGVVMTPQHGARTSPGLRATPVAPGGPPERAAMSASAQPGAMPRSPYSPIPGVGLHPPGPPLSRPVLPRERGALDRVVEYLVGDGPQNRYALICQQCFSHNGMALKEEFEYLAFRCAYCYFLNPARKTRPQAPRLPEFSYERKLRAEPRSPGPPQSDAEESAPPSAAKAPTPWNLVHSFPIQQQNPQNRALHSPDEREQGDDDARPDAVNPVSHGDEQTEMETEEGAMEELVQEEEGKEEEEEQKGDHAASDAEQQPS
ncbi:endoplasmic reticulum junction formation protein lunapark-B isoform X1 [Nerophis ophidion]|uniref:endoplasmic reticulum junction formation protein lunapark-B isoform X1 n=1 Tax=Nerophis ophidion TaxID=159077 RepID=UPI002AE023F8|nr:endoplasmic reticulum junction formation protein lunapark-B isoform X1 [Nerophis ophidion]XP_061767350.1 endoplasmic reticulum junction formation protein lunapark-B isoform X1 [Nerophis ophidion]